MGPDWRKCTPYFGVARHSSLYLYDAWPATYRSILEFARLYHVDIIFVSSSEAARTLACKPSHTSFVWMPEAIAIERYAADDYELKDIDVLHLGRRYDRYHHRIVHALQEQGRTYLFESERGQLVFPTRAGLVRGLARTKVSVCVPSSITHPERSEGVAVMTLRYLQSMAAKCLILGHAPAEMVHLFGYQPVVEIDMRRPAAQLEGVLANFGAYIPLIERNYATVLASHTWEHRWSEIRKVLIASG